MKKRRYSKEQGLLGLLKVYKIHLLLPPTLDGYNGGKSGRKRVISSWPRYSGAECRVGKSEILS